MINQREVSAPEVILVEYEDHREWGNYFLWTEFQKSLSGNWSVSFYRDRDCTDLVTPLVETYGPLYNVPLSV